MSRVDDDQGYMARALELAERALGTTAPNPAVGCVVVRDGRIVGEGWTRPPGGPHAEVVALSAAGAEARGATAYVTLEPCDHTGRTGPCSRALIEAGVARVVCAALDPNPIAGAGVDRLRAAGIDVEVGVLEAQARAVNRGFFARTVRGRPWVRSKLAASLDGRTALASGTSQWITGPDARRDVHRFRARADAILTGIGTVLADDPRLTARQAESEETPSDENAGEETASGPVRRPLRAIVDAKLATPPTARALRPPGDVVIFTTAGEDAIGAYLARLARAGAGVPIARSDAGVPIARADAGVPIARSETGVPIARSDAQVRIERVGGRERCDLVEVVERFAALDVNDVWVEAGPVLNGALLERGLIDEIVLYLAPHVLGDAARGLFSIGRLESLDERVRLAIDDVRRIGDDLRIIARPEAPHGAA